MIQTIINYIPFNASWPALSNWVYLVCECWQTIKPLIIVLAFLDKLNILSYKVCQKYHKNLIPFSIIYSFITIIQIVKMSVNSLAISSNWMVLSCFVWSTQTLDSFIWPIFYINCGLISMPLTIRAKWKIAENLVNWICSQLMNEKWKKMNYYWLIIFC